MDNKHQGVASQLQTFVVETTGAGDELEVCGASIPEEQLELLLRTPPWIVLARNQDGVVVEMMLDMDADSLIARPVELCEDGSVRYLDDDQTLAPEDDSGSPAP